MMPDFDRLRPVVQEVLRKRNTEMSESDLDLVIDRARNLLTHLQALAQREADEIPDRQLRRLRDLFITLGFAEAGEAGSDRFAGHPEEQKAFRRLLVKVCGSGRLQLSEGQARKISLGRLLTTPGLSLTRAARAEQNVRRVFSGLELLLPRRVASEEIGDALEVICEVSLGSGSPWRIYLKLASTIFWVLINAVRDLSSAMLGRRGA